MPAANPGPRLPEPSAVFPVPLMLRFSIEVVTDPPPPSRPGPPPVLMSPPAPLPTLPPYAASGFPPGEPGHPPAGETENSPQRLPGGTASSGVGREGAIPMARRAVESPESAAPDAGVLLAGFRVGAAVEAEGRSRWGCVIEGSRTVIQVAAALVAAGEIAFSDGIGRAA